MNEPKAQPTQNFVEDVSRTQPNNPQRHVPLWQSMKEWPRVVAYNLALSSAILLYGYDLVIVGTVSAMPAFQHKFGEMLGEKYIIPSTWLSLWNAASPIGMMIGSIIGGYYQDRGGRRLSLATLAPSTAPLPTVISPDPGRLFRPNSNVSAYLRNELELPVTRDNGLPNEGSWQTQSNRRYEAGKTFDKLILEIRNCAGFEDFLGALSEADRRAAAQCDLIVVIDVSEHRCDAILFEQNQIRSLCLPDLNINQIKEMA